MSALELERYDNSTGLFVPYNEVEQIGWDELLEGRFPDLDTRVMVTATLYDTPRTTIAALRKLGNRYEQPYASVYNAPRALREVTDTVPGVSLVANLTIPPPEVKDVEAWQQDYTRLTLAAGCAGAVVNFDCVELAQAHPDRLFLRYTEDAAA